MTSPQNACVHERYGFICTLDTPETQKACKHYEPPRDDEPYCRHNRDIDGRVWDRCQCIDARREASSPRRQGA